MRFGNPVVVMTGLWDYDVVANQLLCNDDWYRILGLDPVARRIETIEQFRPFIHPDDVERATLVDFAYANRLIAEDRRYNIEFRIVRPNGDVRCISSIACLIRDPNGGGLRALGCICDITDLDPAFSQRPVGNSEDPEPAVPETDAASALTLTERERECLQWVSLGKTAWETATILGLSRRTIEFHIQNAVRKLGAVNKVHAVAIAVRHGYL